jgi:lycopene cyclase domain-containing protein
MTTGRGAYLLHLTAWAFPVLAAQLIYLFRRHRQRAGALLRAAWPPVLWVTAWLVTADHLAIREGLWRFGEGKHLGLRLGAVPVEEVLFFLTTNALVAVGLVLFTEGWRARR